MNYLLGKDRRNWRTGIPAFGRVRYPGVFPGVDLVFHGAAGALEYDFLVQPGVRTEDIQVRIAGATRLTVAGNGDLLIGTRRGSLRQGKPIAYQEVAGQRQPVTARYRLLSGQRIGFALGAHDPALPLVIDPTLWYSTYLGGSSGDDGAEVVTDAAGAAYVTGATSSTNLIPPGATGFDNTLTVPSDAFIFKYGPTTDNTQTPALVYATYLGGTGNDAATAIDVIGTDAVVTGVTNSTDFPVQNGFQLMFAGGVGEFPGDAFLARLNAAGTGVFYATYLGGTGNDFGTDLGAEANGRVSVGGLTDANFPVTTTLMPGAAPGGVSFVATVDTNATLAASRLASTLIGGPGSDSINGVDRVAGRTFLVGGTSSTAFSGVTPIGTHGGGTFDAFVMRLNADTLLAGSVGYFAFLGGSGSDAATAVTANADGNAYVAGVTASANFPRTQAVDSTLAGQEAFVTRLRADGTGRDFSTFLGGNDNDSANSIALDTIGQIIVGGRTSSTDFPVAQPTQTVNRGGQDGFVARFFFDLSLVIEGQQALFLDFSTYLGGTLTDEVNGVAVDASNNLYAAGTTNSPPRVGGFPRRSNGFPIVNAPQATYGGDQSDAFLTKIGGVEGLGDPSGQILITPGQLTFGNTRMGRTSDKTFRITNRGRTPLTVFVPQPDPPFRVSAGDGRVTVAPRGTRSVTVQFGPDAIGSFQQVLPITTTDPGRPFANLPLRGTGRR